MASPDQQPSGRLELSPAPGNATDHVRTLRRAVMALCTLVLATMFTSACRDEPPAELSVETQLEALAGEDLTPAEIARQVEIAATLCGMSDDVLFAIWDQLGDEQLAFQDFVFGSHCPERSVTYGLATGRTLTPEARVAAAEQQTVAPSGPSSTVALPDTRSTTTSVRPNVGQTGPSISIATDG